MRCPAALAVLSTPTQCRHYQESFVFISHHFEQSPYAFAPAPQTPDCPDHWPDPRTVYPGSLTCGFEPVPVGKAPLIRVGEAEVGDDRSDIADLIGESPSSQHREWVLNRLVQAVLTVIVLAGLAGAWGEGVSSEVEATGADGRLRVTYERFVRNLGQTRLQVRFPPGSAQQGSIRLFITQDYLADNEITTVTPDADTVTADGDRLVYEFPVPNGGPLTVTFDLRPNSGLGVLNATVGGSTVDSVQLWQLVYP